MTDIAGIGSAFIAHSAVRTNEPVTERYPSLLEQFIDTAVICTTERLAKGEFTNLRESRNAASPVAKTDSAT